MVFLLPAGRCKGRAASDETEWNCADSGVIQPSARMS
jgi:hypothetical protein